MRHTWEVNTCGTGWTACVCAAHVEGLHTCSIPEDGVSIDGISEDGVYNDGVSEAGLRMGCVLGDGGCTGCKCGDCTHKRGTSLAGIWGSSTAVTGTSDGHVGCKEEWL